MRNADGWYWPAYTRWQTTHIMSVSTDFENKLNMTGIPYLVKLTKLDRFEIQNLNVSVNVFCYWDEMYPLHISEQQEKACDVNLLLLFGSRVSTHYCFIRDIRHSLKSSTQQNINAFTLDDDLAIKQMQTRRDNGSKNVKFSAPIILLKSIIFYQEQKADIF